MAEQVGTGHILQVSSGNGAGSVNSISGGTLRNSFMPCLAPAFSSLQPPSDFGFLGLKGHFYSSIHRKRHKIYNL